MKPLLPNAGPRTAGAFLAILAIVFLAANHAYFVWRNEAFLLPLLLGGPVLVVGVGGLIEPNLLRAFGDETQLPRKYKLGGAALLLLGFGISAWLIIVFYRLSWY